MKPKSFYIYIAAYLAILVPAPGRFVFGVTILLELSLLMLIGILVNYLIDKFDFKVFKSTFLLFVLISSTILYRQFFVLIQPEIALTLGFTFYLPTLSLFLIGFLFEDEKNTLKDSMQKYLHELIFFITSGLLFFLFRDLFGFGTFTFFGGKHQIYEKVLFNPNSIGILSFFASIPGAFFLEGIILYIHFLIKQKFKVLHNAEEQK